MTSIQNDILDGLSSSTAMKGPCRVATTANIALTGLQTVDVVALAVNDRVLVKNQLTPSENGIWVVDTGPWRRSKDFNKTRDVRKGTRVTVTDGTANAGRDYIVTANNPISIGVTSLTIVEALSSDAGGSAAAAAISAAAALSSQGAAATSASAASTSASAAATSASGASTSATNAATSASGAATSATNAGNSATAAAGSATTASTAATNAGNSATAAAGSAVAAAASASAINLPAPAASTLLVRNAGNTAYDPKPFADVRDLLDVPTYVTDMTALLAVDQTKDKVAEIYASGGADGKFVWRPSDLSPLLLGPAITSTAVNSTTEIVTKVAHTLKTADAVIATTAVNGLALNTIYWAIRIDADNFKLASSRANAIAGTAFNLTGTTNFTVKRHADPNRIVYAYPATDVSGASGAWVRQRASLKVFPEWAGAAHDGSSDDQIAFQLTADLCVALGWNIGLSSGSYKLANTVTISYAAHTLVVSQQNKTVNIVGEGSGNTKILHSGFTGAAFDYQGKIVSAGVTAKQSFEGFAIDTAVAGLGTGFKLDNIAYAMFADIATYSLLLHIAATDVLTTSFHGCASLYGIAGYDFSYSDLSRPNAISFHGCSFAGHNENCINVTGGTAITFYGGTVENFGASGTGPFRTAITLTNPGVEGGMAIAMYGVHIEGNNGFADILVNHSGTDPVNVVLDGCNIQRGASVKTTYNLLVQQNTSTTGKVTVVARSSFRHFASYTPTSGEPCIRFISDPACEYDVDVSGSYFGSTVYQWIEGPKATHARARFIGATAVILGSSGVKSVSRTSAGLYVITLRNALKGTNPVVTAMGTGIITVAYLVTFTATTVTIQCLNLAGAATDPTNLMVTIEDA